MPTTETEFTPSSFVEPTRQGAEIAALQIADTTSLVELGGHLQLADPGYYTDERLDRMTKNDMRYAKRMLLGLI